MTASRPRVVILRGHQLNSWHVRPWRHLADRYDVVALQTRSNWFDTASMRIRTQPVLALRDLLPRGPAGHALSRVPGDRYLNLSSRLQGASIVHSQDLGFWYSMQAARLKPKLGFRLVLTAWETIPFLAAYRNVRTRSYRELVLERTDLFLAATERARACLLLEGAPPERIRVASPGVDDSLFTPEAPDPAPPEHLILSPGRLVWQKGHQDGIRALAALRRGVVEPPAGARPRLLIVGAGPEEGRLRRHAEELGVADAVEVHRELPYAEMPSLYRRASCMILASLPEWYWEEQFGMVLVEAMFSGLSVIASSAGAIPEVTRGAVPTVPPGDWPGLARALADGPLSRSPGSRVEYKPALVDHYRASSAAERLAGAYDKLLGR